MDTKQEQQTGQGVALGVKIQRVIDYCQKQFDANSDEAILWAQCKSFAIEAKEAAQ